MKRNLQNLFGLIKGNSTETVVEAVNDVLLPEQELDNRIRGLAETVSKFNANTEESAVLQSIKDVSDLNRQMKRSYDAGITDAYNSDLVGTYGSANTEIFPAKYKVRANGRTLTKDHAHGRAIPNILADNVVGDDAFELEMKVGKKGENGEFTEEEDTNAAIELAWETFCKKKNFTVRKNMGFVEAMRVVEMARVAPGNCLMRLHKGFEHNDFKFAVDILEEDRLQETYQGESPENGAFGEGNPIRASIEYHKQYAFALAYWILTRHPGEFFSQPIPAQKIFREQVPAENIILFSNLRERPEQDLGMSEIAAVLPAQWRNAQYSRALTIAAICSCIRAFVIEKKLPTGIPLSPEQSEFYNNALASYSGQLTGSGGKDQGASEQNAGRPSKAIRPGEERELPYGYEAKVLAPEFPIAAAHEFIQDNLREIAVGARIPYQELSGDYQNLGFIAGLMCKQPFQRYVRIRQKSTIENLFELFEAWLQTAIQHGWFDDHCDAATADKISISRVEEFVAAAKFKGQQFDFVNPMVQAQSLIILKNAHAITDQQFQDALPNGIKVEKLYASLAQEEKLREKHGLDFDEEAPTDDTGAGGGNAPIEKPEGEKVEKPVKTKVARPRSRGGMTEMTRYALEQSVNGEH